MGFFDFLKSAANYVSEQNQKHQEEYNKYYRIYDSYDDKKLLAYYRSALGTKRMAIAAILRERGCNPNDN